MWDVLIVGAGPAGLSAALWLGRCRRRVLVIDDDRPRNAAAQALHGFLSRDGIPPLELLRISREQLARYDGVALRAGKVTDAKRLQDGFEVVDAGGGRFAARMLLLTTGVVDALPEIPGLGACYGRSVHHCPYCDGWEWRDRPIAVHGTGRKGLKLALELTAWTDDIVLCTDGPAHLGAADYDRLDRLGIGVRTDRIVRLDAHDGWLQNIVFETEPPLARHALFVRTDCPRRSALAESLGCAVNEEGELHTSAHGTTNVPRLYVAGDASRDIQLAVMAAAEGAAAALHMNAVLTEARIAETEANACNIT